MAEVRGMPLLSGPPTLPNPALDVSCRKCNKDLRGLFSRDRRCNHCGYMYCSSCAPYTALMPRTGPATGYDAALVCSFCIEPLTMTAAGRTQLKAMPMAKLRKYMEGYNLKSNGVLEKGELVDIIVAARGPNGCIRPENEQWYRNNSVPTSQSNTPRGFFARAFGDAPPPQPQPPRQSIAPRRSVPNFARPDLDHSDDPPPVPQTNRPSPGTAHTTYVPPTRDSPLRHPSNTGGHNTRPQPYPSSPRQPPRPASASPQRPRASTPQSTPTPPPPPPPSLDELLNMSPAAVKALPVSTIKAILFQNHVRPGAGVLEKAELVDRVLTMIEDERQERARDEVRRAEEEEEERRFAEEARQAREQAKELLEKRRQAAESVSADGNVRMSDRASTDPMVGDTAEVSKGGDIPLAEPSKEEAKPLPPKAQAMAAHLERTGLCVICQDAEANMAIIDCGHLAMCRGCSDLIMGSTRECPLCRTRIVTDARLLRIFKA